MFRTWCPPVSGRRFNVKEGRSVVAVILASFTKVITLSCLASEAGGSELDHRLATKVKRGRLF